MALLKGWERVRDRIAATEAAQRAWGWYQAATPREQLYLTVAGVALTALLVWLLVLSPLISFSGNARADYLQQRETLAWMQANRHRTGSQPAAQARAPGESLLGIANQSARAAGLTFRRYEPTGDSGLNLWLEGVPFNQLVQWLEALERDYAIATAELTVTRRDEPGLVDARVVVEG